jgi:hypothetical protein
VLAFVFPFSVRLLSDFSAFRVSANVLQLGEVADFEALTFNLAPMFI